MPERKPQNAGEPPKPENQFIVPLTQDPEAAARLAAAQAALEAVQQKAVENPAPIPKETIIQGRTFVRYTRKKRVRGRNQQASFVWHFSPGTLVFGRSGEWALQDNSQARGVPLVNDMVQRISVGNFTDAEILYLWVVDENDPDAFIVERNDDGYLQVNIAEYLFDKGLVPRPGVKRKYNLLTAVELIDAKEALCIHLDKPMKSGTFSTTKKKKKAASKEPPKGPENADRADDNEDDQLDDEE